MGWQPCRRRGCAIRVREGALDFVDFLRARDSGMAGQLSWREVGRPFCHWAGRDGRPFIAGNIIGRPLKGEACRPWISTSPLKLNLITPQDRPSMGGWRGVRRVLVWEQTVDVAERGSSMAWPAPSMVRGPHSGSADRHQSRFKKSNKIFKNLRSALGAVVGGTTAREGCPLRGWSACAPRRPTRAGRGTSAGHLKARLTGVNRAPRAPYRASTQVQRTLPRTRALSRTPPNSAQ
jgi:hypothetical protein